MIDFNAAPVLLLGPLPPRLPRAQLRFWGAPVVLTTVAQPPRGATVLARFRAWLGRDPLTMDRDDVYAALATFRAIRKRWRRVQTGPQQELPTVARQMSKPRSMGLLPSKAERDTWIDLRDAPRLPRTRAECPTTRPCTFVRCRHHLKLDVLQDGARRLEDGRTAAPLKDLFPLYAIRKGRGGVERERYVYPGLPLDQMPATCSLDASYERARTTKQLGSLLNVTEERARQEVVAAIEEVAAKLGISYDEAHGFLREVGRQYQREK